ncbi:hypothetical protein RYX36_011850 [Vicia faba]
MAVPVELSNRESLVKSASTSLNSKVVSQYSSLLAPIAVDSFLSVVDSDKPNMVDLRDVNIVKKLGGTVDDTELVKGLVFDKKVSHAAGGPTHPIMLHHQTQNHHHNYEVLFAGSSSLGLDGGGSNNMWSEQQQHQEEHDNSRLHRMMAWNANANINVNAADGGNSGHGAGFVFSTPAPAFGGFGQFFFPEGTPSVQ